MRELDNGEKRKKKRTSWDRAVPSSAQADFKLIPLKLAMEYQGN